VVATHAPRGAADGIGHRSTPRPTDDSPAASIAVDSSERPPYRILGVGLTGPFSRATCAVCQVPAVWS
jgi:hypothetical protein